MFGGNEGGGGFGGNFQSPGGGFSKFGTPSGGDKGGRKFKSQRIIPCTIAHIYSLTNDGNSFKMGDLEVNQVTFVGIITNVTSSDTSIVYEVSDQTASPIPVRKWFALDSDEDDNRNRVELELETYVRVYGQIRNFQNKSSVTGLSITPIEDPNEISTHLLECIKFQIMAKKQPKSSAGPSFGAGFQAGDSFSAGGMGGNSNNGMDKIQSQVFQVVETCTEEHGMHVDEIQMQLKGLNKAQVRNALEFLSNEGHVYSTIDEDHFKSTG